MKTREEIIELLERLLNNKIEDNEWDQVDLTGADLREADLTGALLRYDSLEGVDLSSACLRVANLVGADLRKPDKTDEEEY